MCGASTLQYLREEPKTDGKQGSAALASANFITFSSFSRSPLQPKRPYALCYCLLFLLALLFALALFFAWLQTALTVAAMLCVSHRTTRCPKAQHLRKPRVCVVRASHKSGRDTCAIFSRLSSTVISPSLPRSLTPSVPLPPTLPPSLSLSLSQAKH